MAVRFDAVGDQLNRTANLPPNGSFTYMMWAVIDNEQAGVYQPYLWALDATSQQGYACGVINGIFDIECYNGGVVASSSSVATRPTAGQAACVYARCSGTGAGLINSGYRLATSNAFVSSGTATLGSLNVMTQLYMGGLFGVYWMDGRKWNIKAWDRALSDAEILAESYFDGVLYPASLNFYLPLTGVNDTADRSGNGRNPTTAGTLTTGDTLVQLFRPSRRIFVPRVGSQTLNPPLLTRSKTLYAPTLTPGQVSVLPPLLTRSKTVYAATVTPGQATVAPPLLTRGTTVYAPVVTQGGVALQPPLLTRSKTLFAPSVVPGSVTISPALLTRSKTVFAPTVSPGGLTISPPLLTRAKTLYSPVVTVGAVTLSPPLISRAKVLYPPTVAGQGTISPPLLTRVKVLYAPTVAPGSVSLVPPLLTRSKVIYAPEVIQAASQSIFPPLLVRDKTVFAPTVSDGSTPQGSPHGFVITDTAPKLWWKRKPKALDEEEAEQKVAQVVRVVERIALRQVEAQQPAPAKEQKREVREAIAPLVAEMPGFDWMTLYRTILIELGRRQQEQQAAELAQIEIARIQAMRRDEDDVLILLMSL